LRVELFASAGAFLDAPRLDAPACVVLDVDLPDVSGLDVPGELAARGAPIPVIFITGHGTIPMGVRAMKGGAVEFLTKPFQDEDLIGAIRIALDRDRTARSEVREFATLRRRLESLTPRELDVLRLVVMGKINKQIAAELGTAEQTIKQHRGRVMRKMDADSLAELVRIVNRIATQPWAPPGVAQARAKGTVK
jgi:FixJ family two-component response regulator